MTLGQRQFQRANLTISKAKLTLNFAAYIVIFLSVELGNLLLKQTKFAVFSLYLQFSCVFRYTYRDFFFSPHFSLCSGDSDYSCPRNLT